MLFAVNNAGVPSKAMSVKVLPKSAAAPGSVRFVKLTALNEINGKPWTSAAEIRVLDSNGISIPRTLWEVSASSQEYDRGPWRAIDGNNNTFWHTEWRSNAGDDNDPSHPHSFTIDMKEGYSVSGIQYTPRQDATVNGTIKDYEISVSSDGNSWQTVGAVDLQPCL